MVTATLIAFIAGAIMGGIAGWQFTKRNLIPKIEIERREKEKERKEKEKEKEKKKNKDKDKE